LPSQASACGVIVGEGSRFRSLIVGSFILNDIITTARVNFRCLFFLIFPSYFLLFLRAQS